MKNKKLANRILIFLFLGFIIITLIKIFVSNNFSIELLSFTIEAALVGGIADWFAITALFKKPLGFSWHTALIPNNRDKVINALANMVESELLSYKFIKDKIEKVSIINLLISYIENTNAKKNITDLAVKYGQDILSKVDSAKIACYIEEFLKDKLRKVYLPKQLNKLIEWAIENGEYESILGIIIDALLKEVKKDSTRDSIYKIIDDIIQKNKKNVTGIKRFFLEIAVGIAEETDIINVNAAAESLQKELIVTLTNLKDKNTAIRIKLDEMFVETIRKIETDKAIALSVELWKDEIIKKIDIDAELEKFINGVLKNTSDFPNEYKVHEKVSIGKLEYSNSSKNTSPVIRWITLQVEKYWRNFKRNEKTKAFLDSYIKENLIKLIKSEHHLIGIIVKETLSTFTDSDLNEFIENKAGNDLHWIRINGSIVGAMAGIVIFLFINLFYAPYIVPIIRSLF